MFSMVNSLLILVFGVVIACLVGNVAEKMKEIMPTYLLILWLMLVPVAVLGVGLLLTSY